MVMTTMPPILIMTTMTMIRIIVKVMTAMRIIMEVMDTMLIIMEVMATRLIIMEVMATMFIIMLMEKLRMTMDHIMGVTRATMVASKDIMTTMTVMTTTIMDKLPTAMHHIRALKEITKKD